MYKLEIYEEHEVSLCVTLKFEHVLTVHNKYLKDWEFCQLLSIDNVTFEYYANHVDNEDITVLMEFTMDQSKETVFVTNVSFGED